MQCFKANAGEPSGSESRERDRERERGRGVREDEREREDIAAGMDAFPKRPPPPSSPLKRSLPPSLRDVI